MLFAHDTEVALAAAAALVNTAHDDEQLGTVADLDAFVRTWGWTGSRRRTTAELREVQRLSQEDGVNLAGIKRIIELESHVDALRAKVAELTAELDHAHAELMARRGPSTALVVWQPQRRR